MICIFFNSIINSFKEINMFNNRSNNTATKDDGYQSRHLFMYFTIIDLEFKFNTLIVHIQTVLSL